MLRFTALHTTPSVSTFAELLTIRAEKFHLLEISFCINGSLPFGGRRGDEGIGQMLHGKRGEGDVTNNGNEAVLSNPF